MDWQPTAAAEWLSVTLGSMAFRSSIREHARLVAEVFRWSLIAAPVAALIGSACALFLWSLNWATQTRYAYPSLLFFLPLAGVAIAWMYRLAGKSVEAGSDLIIDEIHEPRAGVPARMAPLILVGTVVTHLFGGSAGREGTAIQIGGSIASTFGRSLRLSRIDVRMLLMVGIAAGFGGVFGTPLAAAVFAMEVIALGRLTYEAISPCLVAGIIGDWSCTAWGVHHTPYSIAVGTNHFEWAMLGEAAIVGVAAGWVSILFVELTHALRAGSKRFIAIDSLRPAVGGAIVIALVYVAGTRDYLGLGVTSPDPHGVSIVSSFSAGGADAWSWAWKILFTAVTIGCGFKGGEVTPLFFIGATMGNALSRVLHGPADVFAGLGFVAVFAGATKTPLACTIMGIELFGSSHATYLAVACVVAYAFSGHRGIYGTQRVGTPKPARRVLVESGS